MKITVARISEFVVNDLVNTMLFELQLDEHLILLDQLNIEMHEKWCSTNVDETSVIDFISIKKNSC